MPADMRAELVFAGKTAVSVRDGFPENETSLSSRDPHLLVGDSAKSTYVFRRLFRKASISWHRQYPRDCPKEFFRSKTGYDESREGTGTTRELGLAVVTDGNGRSCSHAEIPRERHPHSLANSTVTLFPSSVPLYLFFSSLFFLSSFRARNDCS
jgi:hypothetical protein